MGCEPTLIPCASGSSERAASVPFTPTRSAVIATSDPLILTDADIARAQDLAHRLGETAAPGVDEIFQWGVDAVVITTATPAHAELIGRAARSGLPVFCEKPIALDLPGTLQAIAEVEAAGTILQMGFQRRFDTG